MQTPSIHQIHHSQVHPSSSWLQPYDKNQLGSDINAINHYIKGADTIPDRGWRIREQTRYNNEKKGLIDDYATSADHALSKSYLRHLDRVDTINQNIDSKSSKTPNGSGGTRKSKLSKTKYRSHSRRHIVKSKSKSKSKTKRRQKK